MARKNPKNPNFQKQQICNSCSYSHAEQGRRTVEYPYVSIRSRKTPPSCFHEDPTWKLEEEGELGWRSIQSREGHDGREGAGKGCGTHNLRVPAIFREKGRTERRVRGRGRGRGMRAAGRESTMCLCSEISREAKS